MDRKSLVVYAVALIIGLIGMALYLVGYHIWLDHKLVDGIREQIQRTSTSSRENKQ